jgi:hypothetical protein
MLLYILIFTFLDSGREDKKTFSTDHQCLTRYAFCAWGTLPAQQTPDWTHHLLITASHDDIHDICVAQQSTSVSVRNMSDALRWLVAACTSRLPSAAFHLIGSLPFAIPATTTGEISVQRPQAWSAISDFQGWMQDGYCYPHYIYLPLLQIIDNSMHAATQAAWVPCFCTAWRYAHCCLLQKNLGATSTIINIQRIYVAYRLVIWNSLSDCTCCNIQTFSSMFCLWDSAANSKPNFLTLHPTKCLSEIKSPT